MKAILLARTGAPAVLEYVDVPTPTAGAGEVLVKADTIGVSQAETMLRAGTYPWMPPLPVIPGIEMAGTVAALGAGVTTFALGDKVFVSARELPQRAGCYAEYIAVPANALRPLPPDADLEAAASLSNYQVAYHLVHVATRGMPGKSALIDAASGGIGSAAVQLAKLAGMSVIALVGSDAKARALTRYGADHAINTAAEDVASRVREFTNGSGVDLVLNAVGADTLREQLPLLAPLGLAVSYGRMGGPLPGDLFKPMEVGGAAFKQNVAIRFFSMHAFDGTPQYRAESMRYLIARLAEGSIQPLIHAKLPLKEAWRAHEMVEMRQVIGKILLKPQH